MPILKKTLAFVLGVVAGVALSTVLMLPIVIWGGSRPAPFYNLFVIVFAFIVGRGVYRGLCNLFLKKKDVELVYESKNIDPNDSSVDMAETTYESEELK